MREKKYRNLKISGANAIHIFHQAFCYLADMRCLIKKCLMFQAFLSQNLTNRLEILLCLKSDIT